MNLEKQKQNQIPLRTIPEPFLERQKIAGTTIINATNSNENTITLVAGENIVVGQIVCLQKNDSTEDNGKCLVQDWNKQERLETKGIALNDANIDELCTIQIRGVLNINLNKTDPAELKSFNAGTKIYCGENGELVDKINLSKIKNYITIGEMIETTQLLIKINQMRMR